MPVGPFTLRQRLKRFFFHPKQILFIDGQSGRPARNLHIRPASAIATTAVLLAGFFVLGIYFAPLNSMRSIIPQHVQLQRQYDDLRNQLAEAEALSSMKDQQIDAFEEQVKEYTDEIQVLQQRLRMFESILEARKGNGVQMLQGKASMTDNQIRYSLILVKGGNYPRRVSGHCMFMVQSPEGESISIKIDESTDQLPYRMESHNFLDGVLAWDKPWQPDILEIVLFDYKGREISRSNISIEGVTP